ncbi:MAG: hypothetical protein JWO73_64 [Candidatus Taylorbacteria bacterium]|nr:hypothetical protein [Candidatus Taylorbacteria bacterium]
MKYKTQAEKDAKGLLDAVVTGIVDRDHPDVYKAEELLGVHLAVTTLYNRAKPEESRKIYRISRMGPKPRR